MEFFVNQDLVEPTLVTFNDGMNYGQRQRFSEDEVFSFRMVVDRTEFLEKFRASFADLCREMKEEDEKDGDISKEFSAYDYKGLDAALDYPEALYEAFALYMMRDQVFPHYLSAGRDWRSPTAFVINGMDKMTIEAETVAFEGWGYGYRGASSLATDAKLQEGKNSVRSTGTNSQSENWFRRLFK